MNTKYSISLLVSIFIIACAKVDEKEPVVKFYEVTEKVGLNTDKNWKYGGPTVADISNNGRYDLLLGNHDTSPIQLFLAKPDGTFTEQKGLFPRADLHGIAAGDYDKDGDLDLLIALGGGNGLTPQPQRLLRNDNGRFVDVTEDSGLSEMGARGRSVRWIDLDNDGDLDFLQINAEQMANENIPRNILFENNGDGTFTYRKSIAFENIDAERLLISDFNNDGVLDIITFSPYNPIEFWQGNNDFTFTDVSKQWLPEELISTNQVLAVAELDIDNDGYLDYYLARGKSIYQIANNSVNFNEEKQRLDLRDEGNKSHDGITFYSEGDIKLFDFYRFPRGADKPTIPLFIGNSKTMQVMPSEAISVAKEVAEGFPEELEESGWYLGYLGRGKWRLEWLLKSDLAWDLRASITGVTKVEPDWEPQNLGVQDILLKNDGTKFTDFTDILPKESSENNQGVISGDFNNDGHNDLFIYRFGELKQRIPDVLFINDKIGGFSTMFNHGATPKVLGDSHGDMGAAFDYNLDGKLDILSGDDDNGQWHLYQNDTSPDNNYLLLRVGSSKTGVDTYGAKVKITTQSGSQHKLIGSGSASHSQSLLNIVHFGLGKDDIIKNIEVTWRTGETVSLKDVAVNQLKSIPN
ncbi:CRTAC1 family protein [Gelidibacter salicanalis]|uniref:CRTAC1 family protein n=1 Tax=Gelidibacter salicanalis TaxID=291193 RepID=A0A934KLV6_9FLAO|nr:CRTAC1 family protein [Gelidibacter salicanalis]MBJ7880144.1 CRTAC1 family protein [Gelidibacter salicanalis]